MNTVIENSLKQEAKNLQHDYGELRIEIDALLLQNSKKAQHRIIGAFTTAGAMVEKILLWIIKKEGRQKQLINLEGKQLGIFEYKKIIQDIIPKQQIIHINTIGQWRNHVAHANDIENVDEHEVGSVNSALKSFVEWFFEDYLNETMSPLNPPLDKNNIVDVDKVLDRPGELKTTAVGEKISEQKTPKIKVVKALIIVFACLALIYFANKLYLSINKSEIPVTELHPKIEMSQAQVYDLLIKYFNSANDKNANAYDFFADRVDQFYLYKNINPTEVDILRKTEIDYIDRKNAIDRQSLVLHLKTDAGTFWRFWNDFVCYRTTKRKFQSCKVLTEFGFNREGKITSIKEIEVVGLKFTKKKTY